MVPAAAIVASAAAAMRSRPADTNNGRVTEEFNEKEIRSYFVNVVKRLNSFLLSSRIGGPATGDYNIVII